MMQRLKTYNFSKVRLDFLEKTIAFLQKHGEVYLVRLPVSKAFFEMENIVMPEFDDIMVKIGDKQNVPYLDLTDLNPDLEYTDGNHLYKTSGALVSRELSKRILKFQRCLIHK